MEEMNEYEKEFWKNILSGIGKAAIACGCVCLIRFLVMVIGGNENSHLRIVLQVVYWILATVLFSGAGKNTFSLGKCLTAIVKATAIWFCLFYMDAMLLSAIGEGTESVMLIVLEVTCCILLTVLFVQLDWSAIFRRKKQEESKSSHVTAPAPEPCPVREDNEEDCVILMGKKILFAGGYYLYIDEADNCTVISREYVEALEKVALCEEEKKASYQAFMNIERGGMEPKKSYEGCGFTPDGHTYTKKITYRHPNYRLADSWGNVQIPPLVGKNVINCVKKRAFSDTHPIKINDKTTLRDPVNRKIKSVVLPDTVTWIEEEAFAGCESLQTIYVPRSVRKIGDNAVPAGCKIIVHKNSFAYQHFQKLGYQIMEKGRTPPMLIIHDKTLHDGYGERYPYQISLYEKYGEWFLEDYSDYKSRFLTVPENIRKSGDPKALYEWYKKAFGVYYDSINEETFTKNKELIALLENEK